MSLPNKAVKVSPDVKHHSRARGRSIKVSASQQKILNAVKTLAASAGGSSDGAVSRTKALAMCGYTKNICGGFNFALSTMKTKQGFLTYDSQTITLTSLGNELAEIDPTHVAGSTNEAHWEKCLCRIKGQKGKLIFEALRDGKMHTRAALAGVIGYDGPKAGGFLFATSKLVSTGLVQYCQDKHGDPSLRLTDEVFPFGRPDEN
jgi:hypothetical protein